MKVKPNERGSHTILSVESFLHFIPHNILKIRTCFIIKIWGQLRPCMKKQHKESHNQRVAIKAIRHRHGYFNIAPTQTDQG